MVPSAEWVQSVYSCQFEINGKTFIAPNRDYPYEGLLVHQDGENWKFIDCIAVGLQTADSQYSWFNNQSNLCVWANPWKVTYDYKGNFNIGDQTVQVPFSVSYILHSHSTPTAVTGHIEITLNARPDLLHSGLAVIVQPFIDLRHMFHPAQHENHQISCEDKRITTSSHNRKLTFYFEDGEINCFDGLETKDWFYKLGTGSRTESFSHEERGMATVFVAEHKHVAAFFNFRFQLSEVQSTMRIFFSCCTGLDQHVFTVEELHQIASRSQESDLRSFEEIERRLPPLNSEYRDSILTRIVCLTKFKSHVASHSDGKFIPVPNAGAWWFRTVWFRDIFEGILNSFQTLMLLPAERANLKQIILLALSGRDKNNHLVANRLPEFKDKETSYNACDATLLCFIVAHRYVLATKDPDLAWMVIGAEMETIGCFRKSPAVGSNPQVDGPPKLDPHTGLLRCSPHHSWLDTQALHVQYAGYKMEKLPSRISVKFVKDLCDRAKSKEEVVDFLSSPSFFLPEINAQWIEMLRGAIQVLEFAETSRNAPQNLLAAEAFKRTLSQLLEQALQSFVTVFWNEEAGFLYNAVCDTRSAREVLREGKCVRDEIECEVAVTAAAMLGKDVFTEEQLRRIWDRARKTLLVYRSPGNKKASLPFGLMAKNNDDRIFYDDSQYHNDVVWPRSTPYLVKLLQILGEQELVRGLLVNALDHQMSEGAVFYSHELLSRPFGNNVWPNKDIQCNPVPVKNPIQFWSQWCDLLVDFFASEGVVK